MLLTMIYTPYNGRIQLKVNAREPFAVNLNNWQMEATNSKTMGFGIDFKRNWSNLKEQIFYERNGRFAKKDDAGAFNTTHDASSLMELCARDNKVIELYTQFLQAEKDTQRTRKLISQDHEQGVEEKDQKHL